MESGCIIFQEKWTDEHFCLLLSEKYCLICTESIAVSKECNISKHYNQCDSTVEGNETLGENFKMRSGEFRGHVTNIRMLKSLVQSSQGC
jgi:hypothetical protein